MATKATGKKTYSFQDNRVYNFELVGDGVNHQGKYIIPNSALVFEGGRYRKVRLCSTEETPYVDEQSEFAIPSPTPIVFRKGRLTVDGTQRYLLNYLVTLDHNVDKGDTRGGKMFRFKLIDQELTEKERADLKKLKLKVQLALAEASKEDLAEFLLAEYNFTPQTDTQEELFNKASAYAELNPQLVLGTFKSEEAKLKASFIKGFQKQILKNTKGVVTWGDSGVEITSFKLKEGDLVSDSLVDWVSKNSKEALDFAKKFKAKLEE